MKKTKKERRIAILKDVLQQLKLERFLPTKGTYICLPYELRDKSRELDAQKELKSCKKACICCAKGSILLSQIRKENNVTLGQTDWSEGNKATNRVIALFGKKNLDKIEATFEKWPYIRKSGRYTTDPSYIQYDAFLGRYIDINNEVDTKIKNFINKYPDTTDRLVAIIKNSIKNNGIFKP